MSQNKITVLAIESSCDDTGVAVVQKDGEDVQVLSALVTSQTDIHERTGGVIPEAAAREHMNVIGPMIASALNNAELDADSIDAIAVTIGPGLMPSLAIGVQAAKTLAFAWNKQIIPVHHIEGHVYSALLESKEKNIFPALALIVSGGHTMLVEVPDHLTYKVLGETRDDAVGEVFDKVARMLGLAYPGGPKVSNLAQQGDAHAYNFPRPMMHSGDLDFSYSGLKTSVLYQVRDIGDTMTDQQRANIAASFQEAVIDSIISKLARALGQKKYASLLLAGGVAGNTVLRERMAQEAAAHELPVYVAPRELCGDNATMIGQVGVYAYEAGRLKPWKDIDAIARISIEEFNI